MGWTGAIVLIAIRLLYIEADLAHAKVRRGVLVFRAGLGIRLLIGAMIVGLSTLIVKEFDTEEWWVLSGSALFVVLGLVIWPSVTITETGVDRQIWWRRVRSIPWNDVSGIERSASGEIQVFGKKGQRISFTRYHVDPWRFQDEVMRRANLKSVIDASAPPTLRL